VPNSDGERSHYFSENPSSLGLQLIDICQTSVLFAEPEETYSAAYGWIMAFDKSNITETKPQKQKRPHRNLKIDILECSEWSNAL
jgi:hypothetical protein